MSVTVHFLVFLYTYPTDFSFPLNKLSRKEFEVCIKKNLVDVFLVGSASEIFSERFSVTQTLESRVHETRVTCRERLLESSLLKDY